MALLLLLLLSPWHAQDKASMGDEWGVERIESSEAASNEDLLSLGGAGAATTCGVLVESGAFGPKPNHSMRFSHKALHDECRN